MKYCLILLLTSMSFRSFSQQQTFDIVNFTAPKGWTKNVEETVVSYTITDSKTKS